MRIIDNDDLDQKAYNLLGLAQRAGKLSRGMDSTAYEVKTGTAKLVILAQDISERSQKKILGVLENSKVPVLTVGKSENLGFILGRDKAVIVGILDEGFARGLLKLSE